MTNSDLIRDAMGMIGVLRVSQSPDTSQSAQALRVMNDMFFEWLAMGLDLGYSSQSSTTDEFPLDESLIMLTKSNLALRLCPFYERQPPAAVVGMAQSSFERVMRDAALSAREESSTKNMPHAEYLSNRFGVLIN